MSEWPPLRAASLFTGIGGLDLGLEWAGMEIVWQCEINPFCRGVLRRHWPTARLYDDINTLIANDPAPVDVLCGGFPCQPVSLAGRRRGANDARWLWPAMRDVVSYLRPTWVLGENTPGLITMGLDGVLFDLETLGYACRTFVVPACAVDAPHRRDRVFIVAHSCRGGRDQGGAPLPGQAGGQAFVGDRGERTVADAASRCDLRQRDRPESALSERSPSGTCGRGVVGYACGQGFPTSEQPGEPGEAKRNQRQGATARQSGGAWSDAEWITGADGKARRVKPGIRLLAHGIPGRVARLGSLGNAVVPELAFQFGRAIIAAHYGVAA